MRLLFFSGLYTIIAGLVWLGQFADFVAILITGVNIDNSYGLVGLLSEAWIGPFAIIATLIGCKLLVPEKWKIFVVIISITAIVFESFLFFDTSNTLIFIYPESPGSDIIMENFILFSIPGLMFSLGSFLVFMFSTIGFLVRSFQSKGVVKRKFIFLALSFFLVMFSNFFSGFFPVSLAFIVKPISRIGFVLSFIFLYLGLKQLKPKKPKEKKVSRDLAEFASYISGKPSTSEIEQSTTLPNPKLERPLLIFVSYATVDADTFKIHDIAGQLAKTSEIKDVLFWEEHMEDNIFEYMDDNLDKCDVMILFCSDNAKNSVPVRKEWTAAEAIGMPIIPVFYDVNHIPTLLKSRLGVEFDFYNMELNISKLKNLILKKVGGLAK